MTGHVPPSAFGFALSPAALPTVRLLCSDNRPPCSSDYFPKLAHKICMDSAATLQTRGGLSAFGRLIHCSFLGIQVGEWGSRGIPFSIGFGVSFIDPSMETLPCLVIPGGAIAG